MEDFEFQRLVKLRRGRQKDAVIDPERTDDDQALQFLTALFGRCNEGHIEFRPIPTENDRLWVSVNDIHVPALPTDKNIFIGVATRVNGGGTKHDIVNIPALWVDLDFKDIKQEEAEEKLNDFNLEPSIVVESGGGLHLYWLLEEPATSEDVQIIEGINRRLALILGGDVKSADAARILRLPGTKNLKYDPPRDVILSVAYTDRIFKLTDFEKVLPPLQPEKKDNVINLRSDNLLDGVEQGRRNSTAASLTGRLLNKGYSRNEVYSILSGWNLKNRPPLPDGELRKVVESIGKTHQAGSTDNEKVSQFEEVIRESVYDVQTFMGIDLPERATIIRPWLLAGTLNLIYAKRGVGKTWFSLILALAITRRLVIHKWETETPVGCFYIDGEMASDDLQKRVKGLSKKLPEESARLSILSADMMRMNGQPSPNLTDESWRKAIYNFLKNHPEYKVLIIDNLVSLASGLDENDKKEWDPINRWLLSLRALKIAVVMIHHTRKSGDAHRGTSAMEDNLDNSIHLRHPPDYSPDQGARFIVEFTKNRSVHGEEAASFCIRLFDDDGLSWRIEKATSRLEDAIVMLLGHEDKLKQREIAKMMTCSPSYVTKVLQKSMEQGHINKDKTFTEVGQEIYGGRSVEAILEEYKS